jgi:hypothetical protein
MISVLGERKRRGREGMNELEVGYVTIKVKVRL